jgi:hypothetical protein
MAQPASSGSGCGCALLLAGFLLYITFPYCLMIFPLVLVLVLGIWSYEHRQELRLAFTSSEVDLSTSLLRKNLMWFCLFITGIGVFFGFLIAPNVNLIHVAMGTLAALVLSLHLGKLSCGERATVSEPDTLSLQLLRNESSENKKPERPFSSYLLKATREFFFTILLVVAVFAIATFLLAQIPADGTTLHRLRQFEGALLETHVFLEALKFSPLQAVILLVALWCLRWTESKALHRTVVVDNTWRRLKLPIKLLEKSVLITAAASCLTFLGTQTGGVIEPFSAQIRELDAEYADFQREVRSVTDNAIRTRLIERAWRDRPELLRKNMDTAATFVQTMDDHNSRVTEAGFKYRLEDSDPVRTQTLSIPEDAAKRESEIVVLQPASGYVTREIMKSATEQLDSLRNVVRTTQPRLESEGSLNEELVKKTFEAIEPLELMQKSISDFRALNERYPVFGELGSTIASAFNDWAFDRVRSRIAERVAARKVANPPTSLDSLIRSEAEQAAALAPLHWSLYSESWSRDTRNILARNQRAVAESDKNLYEASKERQQEALRSRSRVLRTQLAKLRDLGTALPDHRLSAEADRMDFALRELNKEVENWPPLGPVPAPQIAKLDAILRPLKANWSIQAAGVYRPYPEHQFPNYHIDIDVKSGMVVAAEYLLDYAHEYMLLTVERNLTGEKNQLILKQQLGADFEDLRAIHNQRVASEIARREAIRQEATRRQEEARRTEEFRRQEQERWERERSREVERAHERAIP